MLMSLDKQALVSGAACSVQISSSKRHVCALSSTAELSKYTNPCDRQSTLSAAKPSLAVGGRVSSVASVDLRELNDDVKSLEVNYLHPRQAK